MRTGIVPAAVSVVLLSLTGCSGPQSVATKVHHIKPTASTPSATPLFPGVAGQGTPDEDYLFKIQAATDMNSTGQQSAILQWGRAYCADGETGHTRTVAAEAADASVATIHDSFVRRTVLDAADSALCPGAVDSDPPGFAAARKKAAAEQAAKDKAAAEKKAEAEKAKALHERRANETYLFVRSDSGEAGNITYGIDGSQEQYTNVSLPWRHKIGDSESGGIIVIVAQNAGGGAITCGYEDGNGKTWNTSTSHGQYAVVTCS